MQGHGVNDEQHVDFSDFLDDAAFNELPRSPSSSSPSAPVNTAKAAVAPARLNQRGPRSASLQASTPSASASSGDSPSDALSPFPPTDTALTSASTSPPFASHEFAQPSMDNTNNGGKLPDGLEHLAASWAAHHHHQALQFHTDPANHAAASLGINIPSSAAMTTPLPIPLGSSFPQHQVPPPFMTGTGIPGTPSQSQLPPEWIQAANLSHSYGGSAAGSPALVPGFPQLAHVPAYGQTPPTSGAMPTSPYAAMNHLGQVVANPALDPNLHLLQMSLEAQARTAASLAGSLPSSPAPYDLLQQHQLPTLPTSAGPSSASHSRAPTAQGRSSGPSRRSSQHKSARKANGAATPKSAAGPDSLHQRALTNSSSQHASPLASPGLAPVHHHDFATAASSSALGWSGVPAPATTTYQRPYPPLPPARGDTASAPSSHPSSAVTSPTHTSQPAFPSPADPSLANLSLYTPVASTTASREQSPLASGPVVDYDFSSLEQDLDRFSSLGGFASAAAAAMASVGPSHGAAGTHGAQGGLTGKASGSKPSDAYGIGGYGGSSTPRIAPDALPSPKLFNDVLGESIFPPPFASGSGVGSTRASPAASGSHGTGSASASPAAFQLGGAVPGAAGSAGGGSASSRAGASPSALFFGGSPAGDLQPSPAGSTIIDEESAEVLSRKDPIAAQVWRMFHKAKNTMPNGARMENLTWRLMSMTLKKRREDSAAASASASASAAPSPPTDASLQRAMEAALEEQREESEAREEGRDTVQPLASGRATAPGAGGARGRGGRERSNSGAKRESEKAQQDEPAEEERGRRRRTKSSGNQSKSASTTPEAEQDECAFLFLASLLWPVLTPLLAHSSAMDWRAMSKSRSRSRAPDMMDWRAQSRSRSRAPDFRVSVAPPTIDATPATANFSRFFNDSGLPSPVNEVPSEAPSPSEMPPPPVPSTASSQPPSTSTAPTPLVIPAQPEDDSAALAELATSLGLSPQDQAQLFGSASARLDGHSLLDLPSPGGMASPLPLHSNLSSSLHSSVTSPTDVSPAQAFAFPSGAQSPDGSGPDPNLAAIENTLNQLISLQSIASPGSSSYASTPAQVKSPLSMSYPAHSSASSGEPTPHTSANHSRQPSASSSTTNVAAKGSQAQQHLQQFISVRPTRPSACFDWKADPHFRLAGSQGNELVRPLDLGIVLPPRVRVVKPVLERDDPCSTVSPLLVRRRRERRGCSRVERFIGVGPEPRSPAAGRLVCAGLATVDAVR